MRFRQLRRQAALLGALGVACGVIAGLGFITPALLDQRAIEGARAELSARSGDERAFRLTLPLAPDPAEQDAAVRRAIESDFARLGVDIVVDRIVSGRAELSAGDPSTNVGRAQVMSVPDLAERVVIVEGGVSDGSGLTMQADAAEALGLEPGAAVALGGVEFELTGTWRVLDPLDPRWINAALVTQGSAVERVAVVNINETGWSAIQAGALGETEAEPATVAVATWSVVPEVEQLTTTQLTAVPRTWSLISGSLRDAGVSLIDVERGGDFGTTAGEIQAQVLGLAAVRPVLIVLIVLLGLATFGQLARLLAEDRRRVTRLLWSRGSSTARLAGGAALEAFIVGAAGAALGASIAIAALLGQAVPAEDVRWSQVVISSALVALATALFAFLASASVVRSFDRDSAASSTRAVRTTGVSVTVLASVAAGVSTWQLLLYGSPLTPDAQGGLSVDPVTVASPALVLIAAVLVATAFAPLISRAVERTGASGPIVPALALRNAARRPEVAVASVATAAIAVASLVFAGGYSGTWADTFDRGTQTRAGADFAATVPSGISAGAVDAVSAVDGVTATSTLHVEDIQIEGGQFVLVAVSPDAVTGMVRSAALSDVAALAERLRVEARAPVLPDGTERLALSVAASGIAVAPAVSMNLSDGYGVLRSIELTLEQSTSTETPGSFTYVVELPAILRAAPAPIRVETVDASISADAVDFDVVGTWEMQSLRAAGPQGISEVDIEQSWLPVSTELGFAPPQSSPDGRGFQIDSSARSVRMTTSSIIEGPIPVVFSRALAERTQVAVGDEIILRSVGTSPQFAAAIVGIVEAVPSAPDPAAVLIDLAVVRSLQLIAPEAIPTPRLLWASAADSVASGQKARALLPAGTRVDDSVEPALRSALGAAAVSLWITAAGGAVLAIVMIACLVRAQHRDRRGEVAVVRALGLTAKRQGAIRFLEILFTSIAGLVAGLAAGAAVVVLTVEPFARSAAPAGLPGGVGLLAVDSVEVGFTLAVFALALLAIAGATAGRVSRDASVADGVVRDR